MMKIRELDFDFDITCPQDLDRYMSCGEEMQKKTYEAPAMPQQITTTAHLQEYREWIAAYCKILTDWIDSVFGNGASDKLLGSKTSLSALLTVCDDIRDAATKQGEEVGMHIRQYEPNRAVRRSVNKKP